MRTSQGYTWWERNLPDSYLLKELNSMINDSDRDNNYLLLPEDTILEERYAWKKATASEASPSRGRSPVMRSVGTDQSAVTSE